MTTPFDKCRLLIQQANDESEVVSLVRAHVATWSSIRIDKLPPECRDLSFDDAEGVISLAVHLTTRELKFEGDAERHEALAELARIFVAAALRLGQLRPGPFLAISFMRTPVLPMRDLNE